MGLQCWDPESQELQREKHKWFRWKEHTKIHTHIQTRGHYLYLYLYLLKQQHDLSLGLDSDRRPEVGVAYVRSQAHSFFCLIGNIIGVLSKIHCVCVCVC